MKLNVLLPCCLSMIIVLAATSCDRPVDPPEPLVLEAPDGGGTYYVGDTMEIRWTLNDSISGLIIDFSANNGVNYTQVAAFFANDPEIADGRYGWIIPDSAGTLTKRSTVSNSCKIFIHDYFDYTIGDASDQTFSVMMR